VRLLLLLIAADFDVMSCAWLCQILIASISFSDT